MKKEIAAIFIVSLSSAHAGIITNSATADAYTAVNAAQTFGTRNVVASKNATGQQYSVLRFDLPSQSITGATFRLEWNSAPATWGGANATPMDVGVLSAANNNLWGEGSMNWYAANSNNNVAVLWKNSAGTDVLNADGLRDATMLATMTKYTPSSNWGPAGKVYDIVLGANTISALEALRLAGETSATLFLQSRDGGNSQVGNRFDSRESTVIDGSMAPQLVLQTIPEPTTLGLVAACGTGILLMRRFFVIR